MMLALWRQPCLHRDNRHVDEIRERLIPCRVAVLNAWAAKPRFNIGNSAMTQAQIATVQAAYACFSKGDIPGILALLDPDVAWEHDWGGATLKWYTPRKGREDVSAFFASLADFEFVRFEPFGFLAGENMVAVPIHIDLIFKPNGKRIRDLEMHLWTFNADGKVIAFRHIVDTLQLARQTDQA
ncbi:MAG: nuclear transport factor 2 family protein [Hyphomicrobiaceae bacterium]